MTPYSHCFQKPCQPLEEVVWLYVQQNVSFLNISVTQRLVAKAVPFLGFFFGDKPLVRHDLEGTAVRTPLALLIGPQTKPDMELDLSGNSFECFSIVFQPDGLYKLFGFPVHEITNGIADAASVLGAQASRMGELLGNCRTFEERVECSNQWLLDIYKNSRCSEGISAILSRILRSRGEDRIEAMFRQTGLSKSTFERRFREQIGMSAKLFSRIVRFQAALDLKARSPRSSWTYIAQECGYFDQMHLIHDFGEFTATCPQEALRSVERIYGDSLHAIDVGNAKLPDSLLL